MKVTLYNSHPCTVTLCDENDHVYDAPYSFEDINAAIAYCEQQIDLYQQAISAAICDSETGEVYATCGFDESDIPEEDYYPDDVDESNYDPYLGCDVFEVEPFDYDY